MMEPEPPCRIRAGVYGPSGASSELFRPGQDDIFGPVLRLEGSGGIENGSRCVTPDKVNDVCGSWREGPFDIIGDERREEKVASKHYAIARISLN